MPSRNGDVRPAASLGQLLSVTDELSMPLVPSTKSRSVRSQPGDDTSQLVNSTQAAERVRIGPLLAEFRVEIEDCCCHLGVDMTRRDSIDADLQVAKFAGEGAGHLEDGGFASVVGRPVVPLVWVMEKVRLVGLLCRFC